MRLRYKKLIIVFTLAIMLLGMGTFSLIAPNVNFSFGKTAGNGSDSFHATLAGKSEEDIEAEITTLVKDYFDAKQRVDMDALAECVSDVSHIEEKRLVTEAEYIEDYRNIECTILNDGLQEGAFRVYVYYEAKIYAIDTLVPSLTALYITADKDGKFTIYLSVIKQEDQKAIDALDESDQIKQMIDSVQKKLETIVSKNADVRDFYQMLENSSVEDGTENNTNIDKEGTAATAVPNTAGATQAPVASSAAPSAAASGTSPVPSAAAATQTTVPVQATPAANQ